MNKSGFLRLFARALDRQYSSGIDLFFISIDCWFSLVRMLPSDPSLPLLKIIQSNHSWFKTLDKKLQAITIYAFLRANIHIDFVDSFLRVHFLSVASCIGRDFVRLIQETANSDSRMLDLWKRMVNDPRGLDPEFTGIDSLLCRPTDVDFLKCRISYEAENKMLFILRECKSGSKDHVQHVAWYAKTYLEKNPFVNLFNIWTGVYSQMS
jgi:hypothetical protein